MCTLKETDSLFLPIKYGKLSTKLRESKQKGIHKTQHGFTLVELLVVISIIAVLLAVLIPALSKARYQSRTLICKSNMHQWGLMMMRYAAENKNQFPMYPVPQMGLNLWDVAIQFVRYSGEYKDTSGKMLPCITKKYGMVDKKLLYCPHTSVENVVSIQKYMDYYPNMTLFVGYNVWLKRGVLLNATTGSENPKVARWPVGYLNSTSDKGASTLPIITDVVFKGSGRKDALDSPGERGTLETSLEKVVMGQLYLEYGTHVVKNKVYESNILYGDNHVGLHHRKEITSHYTAFYKNLY